MSVCIRSTEHDTRHTRGAATDCNTHQRVIDVYMTCNNIIIGLAVYDHVRVLPSLYTLKLNHFTLIYDADVTQLNS